MGRDRYFTQGSRLSNYGEEVYAILEQYNLPGPLEMLGARTI